jgi:1,4-alpha-glucan branching enzyme
MTNDFIHRMPFGAQCEDDAVRFRLWAPALDALDLVLQSASGEKLLPMDKGDSGWFELTTDAAAAGSRYGYQLGNGRRVPDPASRFQPNDVHGMSSVVDPCAYDWRQANWRGRPWRDTVLYETHVGAFTTAGHYDGVREKLDCLADIGVTAVELMPLSDFEGRRNWGYDGVLPFAPDSSYGSPSALKQLIDAAHARGLMLFLDVVYNHFGPSGNYLAQYAPDFFTDRFHTPWGEAIDFTRPEVRQFFIHNALYWLNEYRFDGLRFDAVDQIRDPSDTHILVELARTVREQTTDRHVHLVLENDDNVVRYLERGEEESPSGSSFRPSPAKGRTRENSEAGDRSALTLPFAREAGKREREGDSATLLYNAQWNDDFHHAAHVAATHERSGYYIDYAENPVEALGRALAEGFIYQGEFSEYRQRDRGESSSQLPAGAFVNFIQNHDQVGNRAFGERLSALADPEAVEALTAVLLLAPQIPLLFMGEEWGAPQPFYYFCDYEGELADAVREGRRREFASFAAFDDAKARERIPDPNARATFAASRLDWTAAERAAGRRRLALVRRLLTIRQREIVPRLDAIEGNYATARCALRVEWRLADERWLRLAANFGSKSSGGLDWIMTGEVLFASPSLPQEPGARVRGHDDKLELPPWAVLWTLG